MLTSLTLAGITIIVNRSSRSEMVPLLPLLPSLLHLQLANSLFLHLRPLFTSHRRLAPSQLLCKLNRQSLILINHLLTSPISHLLPPLLSLHKRKDLQLSSYLPHRMLHNLLKSLPTFPLLRLHPPQDPFRPLRPLSPLKPISKQTSQLDRPTT